jgi:putative membrane protein
MSYLDDPRVLFATERTLLAWNRTAVGLMGFGFLVERFGLFLRVVVGHSDQPLHQQASLAIGVAFILLGVALLLLSVRQYRLVVRTLGSGEIPPGYWVNGGVLTNLALAVLGLMLAAYLVLM